MNKRSFYLVLFKFLFAGQQLIFAQAPGSTSYQYNGNVTTLIKNKTNYNDYKRLYECRFSDGVLATAEVCQVSGVAVAPDGNIYFSDAGNGRVRMVDFKSNPATIKTIAGGKERARIDESAALARFYLPEQLHLDNEGSLYVMDSRITIRKIAKDGTVSTVFEIKAGNTIDGKEVKLKEVKNFTIGSDNTLYCTLTRHHAVFKITGLRSLEVFSGNAYSKGDVDGDAKTSRFDLPSYIGFRRNGDMLVVDYGNFMIKKVDASGYATKIAGKKQGFVIEGNDGPALDSRIFYPHAVAEDAMGNLVFTQGMHLVKMITPDNKIVTIAGNTNQRYDEKQKVFLYGGFKDGSATEAVFMLPELIAFNKSNNAIIIDANGMRVVGVTDNNGASKDNVPASSARSNTSSPKNKILKAELIAGDREDIGMRNGRGAGVLFGGNIWGMKMSADNYIYVADRKNHLIRKVSLTGNVTTHAGTYSTLASLTKIRKPGFRDGAGKQAMFHQPWDIAIDKGGNVFVADTYNHRIRKISVSGVVSTFAGGGESGQDEGSYKDGRGEEARFKAPKSITIDENNNLYVADEGNGLIREISPEGVVSTLAGIPAEPKTKYTAMPGIRGVGRLVNPQAVCNINDSLLAVTDAKNNYIWTVHKTTGELKILAGTNTKKYSAVDLEKFKDGAFNEASFSNPSSLAVRRNGNILVSDRYNYRIRELDMRTKRVSTLFSNKPGNADVAAPGNNELIIQAICVDNDDNVYFFENNELKKISLF
ncbi:MAG: hypothetical protein KF862_08065 [Chitinophagaceae bacterium]|nr:hypothetical protein [Chitinophagaceae bacterium]